MQDDNDQPEISPQDIDTAPTSTAPTDDDVQVTLENYVAEFSRVTEELSQAQIDLAEAKRKARTSQILDDLIEPYAKKAYRFMCFYSGTVALILVMNGFGCFQNEIDPSILSFMVGSTAATVIGLVGMVLTGIFVARPK